MEDGKILVAKSMGIRYDQPVGTSRGISAAGSASPWHGGGRRFESDMLHEKTEGQRCPSVFCCLSGKKNCPCRDKAPSSCAIDPKAFFVIPKVV